MRRVMTIVGAAAFALLLIACEPAHENIVDTAEPMASDAVEEAPGTEHAAPADTSGVPAGEAAAPTATETATETAAQPTTRTQ